MDNPRDLPTRSFRDQAAFEAWLGKHHSSSKGLWLKIAKKGNDTPSIIYAEAIEAALRHGWIDGQKAPLDASFWLQRLTPRGPRSAWSRINRAKAQALIGAGRMTPAGRAAVDAAKADGRWKAAYAPQSKAAVPADLKAALDASPDAAAFFAGLSAVNRYAILYRLQAAGKPQTRQRRLAGFMAMLKRKEAIHPPRRPRR